MSHKVTESSVIQTSKVRKKNNNSAGSFTMLRDNVSVTGIPPGSGLSDTIYDNNKCASDAR